MSSPHYIGASPEYGVFQKQTITGNSVLTSFALTYPVAGPGALLVVKNNAIQNPGVAYTINSYGSVITFASAPSGADTVYLIYLGTVRFAAPTSVAEVNTYTGDNSTVGFALTSQPYSNANVMVFIDGVLQKYTSNYTISASTVTFTAAPDTSAEIEIYHFKIVVQPEWTTIPDTNDEVLAVAGGKYLVDPPVGGTDIDLPASPTAGDTVTVVNISAANYDVVIDGNGSDIDNGVTPVTLSNLGDKVILTYANATVGWLAD